MKLEKLKTVTKVKRKSMTIRPSGRSSDYISPSFGHGCLFDCSYCYMKRNKPDGLSIATNTEDILTEINNHAIFSTVNKPNQTHSEYITYDISCNEDFALHSRHHEWKKIFEFFRDHPTAMATLATKTLPLDFLSFDPKGKVRIRMSLMPQDLSTHLEPNTATIEKRLMFVNDLIEAGYDVHLNFSPVVVFEGWILEYVDLFEQVNELIYDRYKHKVLSEVIFLTHNKSLHERNVIQKRQYEDLLWTPEFQEEKKSQYGGNNIRYAHEWKPTWIEDFKRIHRNVIPWNTIRYIF